MHVRVCSMREAEEEEDRAPTPTTMRQQKLQKHVRLYQ